MNRDEESREAVRVVTTEVLLRVQWEDRERL